MTELTKREMEIAKKWLTKRGRASWDKKGEWTFMVGDATDEATIESVAQTLASYRMELAKVARSLKCLPELEYVRLAIAKAIENYGVSKNA